MKLRELEKFFLDKVFTLKELHQLLGGSFASLKAQIWEMKRRGDVLALKRGYYQLAISKLDSFEVAGQLVQPSYVSLESALSRYGLIQDLPFAITSVTTKKTQKAANHLGRFVYRHLPPKLFFGIEKTRGFNMAEKEKALLDYFYLDSGRLTPQFACWQAERLQNLDILDWEKLKKQGELFHQKKLMKLVKNLREYASSPEYEEFK